MNLWKNPYIQYMKLELLFAFVLLAIGVVLWSNANDSTTSSQSRFSSQLDTQDAQSDSQFKTQPTFGHAIQPNMGQPHFTDLPSIETEPSQEIQLATYLEPQQPTFQFASYTPAEGEPANILMQAARNLTDSPPISCKSRMKIDLFGQRVIGNGQFLNSGEGRGLTRMDLSFEVSDETELVVSQICDGKFFYRVEQLGKQRSIEFLDLSEFAQNGETGVSENPTQWLSRSGTISLLQNLGTAFDFKPPASEAVGGLNMLHLRGQWKPSAISNILNGKSVHLDKDTQTVNWRRLPKQVPHGVDVYLGNDEFLPLFPYRIVFFQIDSEDENVKHAVVTMELYEVEKVAAPPIDLFRVNTNDSRQIDLSSAYRERIKQMVDAAANKANKSTIR